MNKIRVIDLLNKIANGEETKPIDYNGEKNLTYYLYDKCGEECDDTNLVNIFYDEVEIIEEDNKIEKLKCNEKSSYNQEGDTKKVQKILLSRSEQLKSSINEIIDYLEEKE